MRTLSDLCGIYRVDGRALLSVLFRALDGDWKGLGRSSEDSDADLVFGFFVSIFSLGGPAAVGVGAALGVCIAPKRRGAPSGRMNRGRVLCVCGVFVVLLL